MITRQKTPIACGQLFLIFLNILKIYSASCVENMSPIPSEGSINVAVDSVDTCPPVKKFTELAFKVHQVHGRGR